MDILLLNPPISAKLASPKVKGPFSDVGENLGLCYIASSVRERGYTAEIFDAYLTEMEADRVVEEILLRNPNVLAVSIPSVMALKNASATTAKIREANKGISIVVGGHYATICHETVLRSTKADALILSEGERTLVNLYETLSEGGSLENVAGIVYEENGTVKRNPGEVLTVDLDSLPFPSRELLPAVLEKGGFASVLTSRGCYGKCTFCSSADFLGKSHRGKYWRPRSSGNVVDEIELLNREYGVGNLVMIDDSFIGSLKAGGERAVNIAEEIIRRGLKLHYLIMCKPEEVDRVIFAALKKSGLAAVSIGIESGAQSGLDRMNRNCTVGMCREALSVLRELDLEVFIGLIPFDPDTTAEELEETIDFLYSMGELNVSLFRKRMMCLPGSGIERSMSEQNRLENGKYTISDRITEQVCRIMETAGKSWGNQLNCYLYNSLWRIAISDGTEEKCGEIRRQAREAVNEKSRDILKGVIESVREGREESVISEQAERETESLYREVSGLLERIAY